MKLGLIQELAEARSKASDAWVRMGSSPSRELEGCLERLGLTIDRVIAGASAEAVRDCDLAARCVRAEDDVRELRGAAVRERDRADRCDREVLGLRADRDGWRARAAELGRRNDTQAATIGEYMERLETAEAGYRLAGGIVDRLCRDNAVLVRKLECVRRLFVAPGPPPAA